MHDIESASWLQSATTGCDKGWLTDLRYIGTSGTPGVVCHTNETNAGISIIQRLDVSGTESYPRQTSQAAGYAKNFAHYVNSCPNIHVWIVGNEPNFTEHESDPDCTSAAYAAAYVEVHKRVHALPGHQNDVLLVASNSPYSPGCLQSLRQIIQNIQKAGIQPDGFALHAYTRASTGSALNTGYVTSTQTQQDGTYNKKCGSTPWNDTWHSHFRIYADYIKVIEDHGLAGRPVFLTESGNACDVSPKNSCYPDADVGYFQALYAEANRWNQLTSTRTKIRAITPYRWTLNQDGTDRDFAIGNRPKLLQDLKKAFGQQYSWTSSKCGSTPDCTKDSDCKAGERCNAGKCVSSTPGCNSTSQCPNQVCTPNTCSDRPGQCILPGNGPFSFTPTNPAPGASNVKVSVSHPKGWAFIGLDYCGPTTGTGQFINVDKAPNGDFRWNFTIGPLQQGLYRIDFTADNNATIVASTNLLVAPPCTPQPETCNGLDDNCDGQIDNGVSQPCYEGAPSTAGKGICKQGTQICNAGTWGPCIGQQLPQPEQCNGKDDDCDGKIDNGCNTPPDASSPDIATKPDVPAPTTDRKVADLAPNADQNLVILDLNAKESNTKPTGCGCESTDGASMLFLLGLLCLWGVGARRRAA